MFWEFLKVSIDREELKKQELDFVYFYILRYVERRSNRIADESKMASKLDLHSNRYWFCSATFVLSHSSLPSWATNRVVRASKCRKRVLCSTGRLKNCCWFLKSKIRYVLFQNINFNNFWMPRRIIKPTNAQSEQRTKRLKIYKIVEIQTVGIGYHRWIDSFLTVYGLCHSESIL